VRLNLLAGAALGMLAASPAFAQVGPGDRQPSETVVLRALSVTEDRNSSVLIAEGEVEVRVGERTLRADRLVYDRGRETMRAQGRVQITDGTGAVQFADEIEVDDGFRNGFALRFATRLDSAATAVASSAIRTDGVINALEQVVYTGCPVCQETGADPTWALRARRAVQNQTSQMITYQDAVLEVKGVPVLYAPYLAHPDPSSERRSGFLNPDLGVSSKLGAFYEQPYYHVLSPSEDVTIAPMLSARMAPLVKVDYRRRFFSGVVDIESSLTNEQEFDSDGELFGDKTWRSHIYGSGRFRINEDWSWGFGVERQTDDLYDLRYDIDGEDVLRGLYASQPRQLLSQIYAIGQTDRFYLEAGMLSFQGLRAGDDDARFPTVAPSFLMRTHSDLGEMGRLSTSASAAVLLRDEPVTLPDGKVSLDSSRASVGADWSLQRIAGPFVLAPFASVRGDVYHLDDGGARGEDTLGRGLALAGAQVSVPFARVRETMTVLVEPVVMAAWGSSAVHQGRIPNEDSLLFEADDSNILSANAISNYDLWDSGGRLAAGVNASASFTDRLNVKASIARRWRDTADPTFGRLSNLSETASDYVGSVRFSIGASFRTGARFRLDDDFQVNRLDLDASGSLGRVNGAARYFEVINASGGEDKGLLLDGGVRIARRWSAIFQQQRNIAGQVDLRISAGLAYQDECSYFAVTYERSGAVDRTLGPSESVRFQFVLTGLGGPRT